MRQQVFLIGLAALISHPMRADDVSVRSVNDGIVVVDLNEPYSQVCAGGAGRYLILQLKQSQKLALFDIEKAAVIKTIESPSDDVMIAAGVDKMVLVVPGTKLIHRYSLPDLNREQTTTWTDDAPPQIALMGCASKGPLILWGNGPVALWNLNTLRPLEVRGDPAIGDGKYGFRMSVSADGRTFCTWVSGLSGQPFYAFRLTGNILKAMKSPHEVGGAGWVKPNANGSLFIIGGSNLADGNLKPIASTNFKDLALQPTEDPRYFVGVSFPDQPGGEQVWICSTRSLEKMAGVRSVGSLRFNSSGGYDGYFGNESRMRFLPQQGLMATLPKGDKQIRVIPADLQTLIKEKKEEFLHLVSVPPREAIVEQPYLYQMECLTSHPPVTYRLETQPNGMTVDEKGVIKWTPKDRPKGGIEQVVIAARTSNGKEAFQTFTIHVERGDPAPPASKEKRSAARPGRPPRELNAAPEVDLNEQPLVEASKAGFPISIDEHTLELPNGRYQLASGLAGRSLLLLQEDRLTILGADGTTVLKHVQLPKSYLKIAEREGHWVGVTDTPFAVEILQKDSFAVMRSIPFSAMEVSDLALHPRLPVAYVACKTSIDVPRYRFFKVDELKGEAHEAEDCVGSWLRIDPSGRFLVSGYSDIYEEGAALIMNPDRWHVVPEYGSLDFLIRYELNHDGQPRLSAVKVKAGGNGRGIRLSPDGKSVSYLSVVGSPPHSGNLAGWDPMDLDKLPIIYGLKDKGSTEHFAYHPLLPLAASFHPERGPVMFQRDTGEEQPDRFATTAGEWENTKLHDLHFSPNGRAIVFETSVNEVHYLHSVRLKLNAHEVRAMTNAWKAAASKSTDSDSSGPAVRIALRQLDALRGAADKEMSAKDIGREFMNSVVLVQSDGNSGSGFVVGSDGYIVTCEHCLPASGEVRIRYRTPNSGASRENTAAATVVKADRARDLALVRIAASKLQPVRLGSSTGLESGARVTAIGNPGLDKTILDFTMTDGIVSNPQRQIAGRRYIQTTAIFNRGSSGGPLFDDRGSVVGMIAANAGIEATGFATPANEIIEFLVHAAEKPPKQIGLKRQWRDVSEKYAIDAQLATITKESVTLLATDGRELTIEKSRLSKSDQELIRIIEQAR